MKSCRGVVRAVIEQQEQARFDRSHFKDFGDSSLNFEVAYWMTTADYTAYMDTQEAINLALMRECASLGVEYAFPTRTVQLQMSEPLAVSIRSAGTPPASQA